MDVFVVVGHVGLRMPEIRILFEAIRAERWFTPIVFLAGHAHVRDARSLDARAFGMASGRYFETIGWLSVDGITAGGSDTSSSDDDKKGGAAPRKVQRNDGLSQWMSPKAPAYRSVPRRPPCGPGSRMCITFCIDGTTKMRARGTQVVGAANGRADCSAGAACALKDEMVVVLVLVA